VAASLVAHALVLALLWFYAPRLPLPLEAGGPPEAVIPVLIMPRAPPPAAAPGAKPQPIRLHRRPQPFAPEPAPVAPLVTPEPEVSPKAAPGPGPRVLTLPNANDAVAANAKNALRGKLGCANADLLGLSKAEREACENALAAGAKQAPYLSPQMDPDKAKGLAAAAARREQDYNYTRSIKPSAPNNGQPTWDKYRGPPGATDRYISETGNDRGTATVPF
jgi:hypothetical protein